MVDLKLVNEFNIPHNFPLPILVNDITKLAESIFFGNFDLLNGYRQFDFATAFMDCQSSITPDGVYTPTLVLHGTTNGVADIQESLERDIPPELRESWKKWLGFLLHEADEEKLVENIVMLLKMWTHRPMSALASLKVYLIHSGNPLV